MKKIGSGVAWLGIIPVIIVVLASMYMKIGVEALNLIIGGWR